MVWPAIIAAAGALAAGALANRGAKDANAANLQIAREQMAFQERMSNTEFWRRKQDLVNVGLNPMLMANSGGASTPQGASAVMQNTLGAGVSGAGSAMSAISGIQGMLASDASIEQTKAATDEIRGRTLNAGLTTAAQAMQLKRMGIDADIAEVERWIRDGVKAWSAKGLMADADTREYEARGKEKTFDADVRRRKAESRLTELERDRSEFYKGPFDAANRGIDWLKEKGAQGVNSAQDLWKYWQSTPINFGK